MADDYLLEPRLLDEAQAEWVGRFTCGSEWWNREVDDFLHNHAMSMATEGFTTTILFSLPGGAREIVGFITAVSGNLPVADVSELVELPDDAPQRVPSVLIPFMGVAREYQHRPERYGREIHLQLLESIADGWPAVRFVYLECWEENRDGLLFWERRGYTPFKTKPVAAPDGTKHPLVRLFLDRLAVN